jgi:hypothetical protein
MPKGGVSTQLMDKRSLSPDLIIHTEGLRAIQSGSVYAPEVKLLKAFLHGLI